MDDKQFLRLLRINEEPIELCCWLNGWDLATASRLIPITDDLTHQISG